MSMDGSENKTIQRTLEAFYEAETAYLQAEDPTFTAIAATLDPECVIYQPRSLPYGGEWRGHRGFEQWMQAFAQVWASLEVKGTELISLGDVVMSRSEVTAKRHGSDQTFHWPLLQYFRFRNCLILELWPFYWDTASLLIQLEKKAYCS